MAAKKKSRKASRKKRKSLIDTIEKELSDIAKALEKRLSALRKELDKAERQASTGGARVIRDARKRINKIEIKGHSDFESFLKRQRRELSKTLTGLEKSVRPKKKKARKKKARAKKKGARR